jgi:DNA-directed RNA polymerase subunit RPC12/RpoP
VALDERSFFSDRNETRPARYSCPRCNRSNEYSIRWVRRMKKDRLPPGADERDRAKFAKLRDHLIRVDDEVVCKTCGKKFEIPSLHSLLFVDQLEGLPKDIDEEEGETPAAAEETGQAPRTPTDRAAETNPRDRRLPRRFSTPSRGWKG